MVIYAISEAAERCRIRYVGIAQDAERRLAEHVAHRDGRYRFAVWLKNVLEADGYLAGYRIETVSSEMASEAERYWIRALLADGHPLLNEVHTSWKAMRQPLPDYAPSVRFAPELTEPDFAWPFSWLGVSRLIALEKRAMRP